MIYEEVTIDQPVRQGDIFIKVPKVELRLGEMVVAESNDSFRTGTWDELLGERDTVSLLVAARPVMAIVISQDCDAARAQDISMCEVRPFHSVEGHGAQQKDAPKKWISLLTQQARKNQKWFYLPTALDLHITEQMAVDFRVVIQLPLDDLRLLREQHRVGRLNGVASEHFRERISDFFRRYAYDEWYPLDREEFAEYQRSSAEPIQPFPWQESSPEAND